MIAKETSPGCYNIESKKKSFQLKISTEDEALVVTLSEKNDESLIAVTYKENFLIDYLYNLNNFFKQCNDVKDVSKLFCVALNEKETLIKAEKDRALVTLDFTFVKITFVLLAQTFKGITNDEFAAYFQKLYGNLKRNTNEIEKIKSFYIKKINNLSIINKKLKKENSKLKLQVSELDKRNKNLEESLAYMKEMSSTMLRIADKIYLKSPGGEKGYKKTEKLNLFVESTIADSEESKELLKTWLAVPNKTISSTLIYRGTRDGDSAKSFHKICDGSEKTLALVKAEDGTRFGGFTTKSWGGSGYKTDHDSFLFNLNQKKKFKVLKPENAIVCSPRFCVVFGMDGKDISISTNYLSHKDSYSFPSTAFECNKKSDFVKDNYFGVSELEVYKITFS